MVRLRMDGFIFQVVSRLYKEYGEDVSSLEILLPNRRARLFFDYALSKIADKPLWQPTYRTIDEVMEQISGLTTGDPTRLITELYKVYSKYHLESFDAFYFWGEMLLADFDAIDKYRIDADMLFTNISDLKSIDDHFSYLTPEQIEVISHFWNSFGEPSDFSQEKQKFITVWRTLSSVYHDFKSQLLKESMAYTGMIYRDAVDKIEAGETGLSEKKRYVIVGFNALSECEKKLFDYIAKEHDALFFWDYDHYYLNDKEQEAGLFMRDNMRRFAQKMTLPYSYNAFSSPKNITVVSAPSESLQCKYVGEFLAEIESKMGVKPDQETAIVLADENLLMPTLYSIPSEIDKINVTMGYPIRLTLEYSFVERLVELISHKQLKNSLLSLYHSDVVGLLTHPFVMEFSADEASRIINDITTRQQVYVNPSVFKGLGGLIELIFAPLANDSWKALSNYLIEVTAKVVSNSLVVLEKDRGTYRQRIDFMEFIIENIRKLSNSIEDCGVEMSQKIFCSLMRKMLQNIRVPYKGEPLEGVQVMGILETRNLDFKNVVILSVNDDKFPGNRTASSSFIPYNLRLAYGLPTPLHHEGVYAYYFYRLLQRAENVHLVYNSRSDEKSSGEQSRYIYQLDYESPHALKRLTMGLNVNLNSRESIEIAKRGDVLEKLRFFTNNQPVRLSPTAFSNYLACPLQFYFYSIAKLRPDQEIVEEIDAPMFGTLLHSAVESLYRPLVGTAEPKKQIESLIGSKFVSEAVGEAIRKNLLGDDSVDDDNYGGNILLIRDIVIKYINTCLLPYDVNQADFRIKELEKELQCEFAFGAKEGELRVQFGGFADRIDVLNSGLIRVVDYKTGREKLDFRSVEDLFGGVFAHKNPAAIQAMLYAMMISRMEGGKNVQPALYYVRELNKPEYSPLLFEKSTKSSIDNYLDYSQLFESSLSNTLAEIFDADIPFTQCEDVRECEWCNFNVICKR